MKTTIAKTKQESGAAAATLGAKLIREAIRRLRGQALPIDISNLPLKACVKNKKFHDLKW